MERLDKIISVSMGVTRSRAKQLIRSAQVKVGTEIVTDPSVKAAPEQVSCSERQVVYKKHIYIMMNKPAGVVSASEDARERTVTDLVPEKLYRKGLFPAGRLDKDTLGFVLLTDDGDFAHRILSPKNHILKTYEAVLDKPVGEREIQRFKDGVILGDGSRCLSALLEVAPDNARRVRIKICEGKYHQIKRMFAAQGVYVEELCRTAMGALALDGALAPGECRELSEDELSLILKK